MAASSLSSNLASDSGATFTFHVDAMPEENVNAGKRGNVTASNPEHSSSVKIRTNRHLGDSSVFSATGGCFETSGAVLRELELLVADIGCNEGFSYDSAWCVLSFHRCSLSGLPHHLTYCDLSTVVFSL